MRLSFHGAVPRAPKLARPESYAQQPGNVWAVLIGSRAGRRLRIGALVAGTAAAVAMGVVGCTIVVDGAGTADPSHAGEYRASVSESVSASLETSRIKESQRQQSLTTQAIRGSCVTFASASNDAVDAVNKWVEAFNSGGNTSGTAGPAVAALNNAASTADSLAGSVASADLRDKFTAYASVARAVADAINTSAGPATYNARKDELNDIRTQTLELCKGY